MRASIRGRVQGCNANLSGKLPRHKFKKIHAAIRLAFELTTSVPYPENARIGRKSRSGAMHVNNIKFEFEAMLGLLLLFTWVQNTDIKAVAWWGSAHLLRAGSITLFGMLGGLPNAITIDLANAILLTSFAVT
jgi:hypothetical protein